MKLNLCKMVICVFGLLAALPALAQARMVGGDAIMDQDMEENLCALTFDDGPAPTTPILLDMLAEYKIPATFFVLGKNASYYPKIIKRIVAEGHEIGNHSWSHPNLKHLTTDAQIRQITETDTLLRSLGAVPLYVRPPYGAYDERTERIAEELGLSLILWSMDSKDWKRLPENYAKVPSSRGTVYEDGALRGIFLFHDIHKTTVDDFPKIVANLRAGGCDRFVTVSEYLKGVLDPEPPLLMTRVPVKEVPATATLARKAYGAGSGPIPMARCSEPWREKEDVLSLDEAHAAANISGQKAF